MESAFQNVYNWSISINRVAVKLYEHYSTTTKNVAYHAKTPPHKNTITFQQDKRNRLNNQSKKLRLFSAE